MFSGKCTILSDWPGRHCFSRWCRKASQIPRATSTETAIYQSYIESCLTARGKAELLEGNYRHTAEADIRAGVLPRDYGTYRHRDSCIRKGLRLFKKHRTFNPRAAPKCRRLCETALDHRGRGTARRGGCAYRRRSIALAQSCAGVRRQDAKEWPVEFCIVLCGSTLWRRRRRKGPSGRDGSGVRFDLLSGFQSRNSSLRGRTNEQNWIRL